MFNHSHAFRCIADIFDESLILTLLLALLLAFLLALLLAFLLALRLALFIKNEHNQTKPSIEQLVIFQNGMNRVYSKDIVVKWASGMIEGKVETGLLKDGLWRLFFVCIELNIVPWLGMVTLADLEFILNGLTLSQLGPDTFQASFSKDHHF